MQGLDKTIQILLGASLILFFVLFLSFLSPPSYETTIQQTTFQPQNASFYEKLSKFAEDLKNFIFSYPMNIIIGLSLVSLSFIGSYYSKATGKLGEVLRTLGPAQGYIFGAGLMMIATASPLMA